MICRRRSTRAPFSSPGTCSSRSRPHPPALAALDRARATFVAVETSSWPLVEAFGPERFLAETTDAGANVLLANEREAEILTGVSSTAAARALGERYRVACVKLGEKGAAMSFEGSLVEVGGGARRRGRRDRCGRRVRRRVARRARARHRTGSRAPACVSRRSPRRVQRANLAGGGPAVSDAFVVTEEVLAAQADGRGIVALETSVIGQGLAHSAQPGMHRTDERGDPRERCGAGVDRGRGRLGRRSA